MTAATALKLHYSTLIQSAAPFIDTLDDLFFWDTWTRISFLEELRKMAKRWDRHIHIFLNAVCCRHYSRTKYFFSRSRVQLSFRSRSEFKVCPPPANPFAKELFHKICVRLTPCVGFCEHKNLLGYFKAHTDLWTSKPHLQIAEPTILF